MPTLKVSKARIEYLELGRGEPVVLLHSSGSSSTQWRALADQLSKRHHVVAPDFYGYGDSSPWPGHEAFRLECEVEIVVALLARLGGRAHLVGHSYGGAVALQTARFHRDSLFSLTLIEPAAFHLLRETNAAMLAETTEVAESLVRALASGAYIDGFGRFFNFWNGPDSWNQIPAEKRYALAARFPRILLDFHAAANAPTQLADLRTLTLPTLLVQGTRSLALTQYICALLANTLPAAELGSIVGAGHMAPLTHPDPVNALIAAHIDSHSEQPDRRAATESGSERKAVRNAA